MAKLTLQAIGGLLALFLAMAAVIFGTAGTVDYWQAWLFLGVYFSWSLFISFYLALKDPALFARRMRGGPWAEKEPAQKIIMVLATLGFIGLAVVPALDHRFRWSHLSTAEVLAGDVLLSAGWLAILFVFRANSFTSATIELAPDQKVVSTGPYAVVRHPMYAAAVVMLIGISPALGSWWGVPLLIALLPVFIWRLLDEERFLSASLPGYVAYKQKVRHRLVPHLW